MLAATLLGSGLAVGGVAQVASASIATVTTVTATNPIGTTPGKVVMTGKVRPMSGTGIPTGTCTFVVDTTTIGTKVLNSFGRCSLTTHVKLGSHTIKISYGGSAIYGASSGSTTLNVTH